MTEDERNPVRVTRNRHLRSGCDRELFAVCLVIAATVTSALLIVTVVARPALAHGGDESRRGSDLVLQAIALIVNEPDNREMIDDKITDALDAANAKGVDLALVQQAQKALATRQLHRARALLERAIGARPHRGSAEPAPIRQLGPAPKGAEPGRAVPSDRLPGRTGLDSGDWAVMIAAIGIATIGVLLTIRYRPRPPQSVS